MFDRKKWAHDHYIKNKEKIKKQSKQYVENHLIGHAEKQHRLRQRRQKTINDLKINGCAICGYNKNSNCLDFHHVNPKDKKFKINQGNASEENLIKESMKCILLCKNCHYDIHSIMRE